MNRTARFLRGAWAFPLLGLAACASSSLGVREALAPRPTVKRIVIAQVALGPNAPFVQCIDEDCPRRTPKTAYGSESSTPTADLAAGMKPASLAPTAAAVTAVTVGFSFNDAALNPEAKKALLAALPVARQATKIVLRGRTDNIGNRAANERLALLRAAAVREFLVRHQVQALHTIKLDTQGSCCYVAENSSREGRARNRRVEIEFLLPEPKGVRSL